MFRIIYTLTKEECDGIREKIDETVDDVSGQEAKKKGETNHEQYFLHHLQV